MVHTHPYFYPDANSYHNTHSRSRYSQRHPHGYHGSRYSNHDTYRRAYAEPCPISKSAIQRPHVHTCFYIS